MKIRFEKREKLKPLQRFMIPVGSVLLALLFCGIMMALMGHNPFIAYKKLFFGGFGNFRNLTESVMLAIPLMFCSLGVSISFKMSLNNIGAEGQYMMGAFGATLVALYCPWIPPPLVLPAMFLAGFLCGGLWSVIAVAPKALWGVNETIITLMFNYVALLFCDYFLYGPWRDASPQTTGLPYSSVFPAYARMSTLGNTRVTWALFIAVIAAIAIFLFFAKTTRGYQVRVIGANRRASEYAGMDIAKNIFLVMLFSGGLAALAGVSQVAGVVGRLQPNMAGGDGYAAITIAYLCKFNPLIVLIVSVLFGGLTQGGFSLQLMGIPVQIVTTIQGLILFFVLGGEIFARNRLLITFNQKSTGVPGAPGERAVE